MHGWSGIYITYHMTTYMFKDGLIYISNNITIRICLPLTLQHCIDFQGFEDDDHCLVSDDGICSFSYSDHCSYLELVQFLEFLPCVPVTFVTPLSEAEAPYSYVGATGLNKLMQDTGIPSVRHSRKGEKMDMYKNHLAPKRPVEAAENDAG